MGSEKWKKFIYDLRDFNVRWSKFLLMSLNFVFYASAMASAFHEWKCFSIMIYLRG